MKETDGLTLLVLNAASGVDAVTQAFAYRKAIDAKFSLSWLAKKLDLKSRGSLSEMLRGKKAIPARIRPSIAMLLTQNETLAEIISLMLELEDELPAAARTRAANRLHSLRSYLTDQFVNISMNQSMTLFASDVFCAFALFTDRPTERQLIEYFGRERYRDVQAALRILTLNELVESQDGYYQRSGKSQHLLKLPDGSPTTVQEFLKDSLRDAFEKVDHWSREQELACFGSTVLSVRRADYIRMLQELRKDVFKYFSALETTEGEMLVRFNMQVYPLKDVKGPIGKAL